MLGLLQKHCPVCGMDIDKNAGIKRFGKYFCSEEHASQYAEIRRTQEMKERDDSRRGHGGGCC